MTDKSFGDHTNRSIVKNPLLSTAVTGLSLEDLTHKAVLLPVTPSLGQITRSAEQQGSEARTLAHPDHETPTLPSGDAFSNIASSNTTQITSQNILDSKNNVKLVKNLDKPHVAQSKASVKSDDDFDVNEYIARLQGSRYVSAPLHSHMKEDQNANLEATEENLEEINLNESQSAAEVQQSLRADIAQNFSQLPTVLPHVASAVFSSFSNMLSYKSREQTPDQAKLRENEQKGNKGGYDEVQFQRPDVGVPMMGVEDYGVPKEVAPPPKEPPTGGTSSFRITTKKKYAQIPGLSSGDAQPMTYNSPGQNIPIGQNMPPFPQHSSFSQNAPPIGQNVSAGQGMPPIGQSIPPIGQSIPPIGQSMPPIGQSMPPIGQSIPPIGQKPFGQSMPPVSQNVPPISQLWPPISQNVPPFSQNMAPVGHSVPIFNPYEAKTENPYKSPVTATEAVKSIESNINTQNIVEQQSQFKVFNPALEKQNVTSAIDMSISDIQTKNLYAAAKDSQNFFTPIEHKEVATPQNIPTNQVPSNAAIIPPPPMFSNLPRKESQSTTGKSILPPSVARRISANQPIIKPAVSASSFTENIFVPAPISEGADKSSQAESNLSSSAFVPAYTTPLKSEPIRPPSSIPPLSQMSAPHTMPPSAGSQTSAAYFIPSNEDKVKPSTDAPAFFSPKETAPPVATAAKVDLSSASSTLASAIPMAMFSPMNTSFGSTPSNIPASNMALTNTPLSSSIFTPKNIDVKESAVPPRMFQPPTMFQPPPQSLPAAPTFFNPLQQESVSKDAPHPITQMPPTAYPEPPKPVVEPPKAAGNVNFRMTKKRPQYYAGPIEGVGAISNNVKPLLAPVIPSATPGQVNPIQGTLFTPDQPIQPAIEQYIAPNTEQTSVPFDISRPVESSAYTPFETSKPQEQTYISAFNISQPENKSYGQEYNTAFDVSRPSDTYSPPKQEFKGFGIIGSLKSKLSSIDINKIQSTVTTFFDPAYNDAKISETAAQDNKPYGQQFGQTSQGQTTFDIFVPNVEQNQYTQFKEVSFDYSSNNQYYPTQDPYVPNQGQNVYSTSSYFTNPNYSTDQVHSGNPLYDNTRAHLAAACSKTSIPEKVESSADTSKSIDSTSIYNPNACTQESVARPFGQQSFDVAAQNKDEVKQHAAISTNITSESQENINYYSQTLTSNLDIQQKPSTSNYSQQNIHDQQTAASVVEQNKPPENIDYYNPNAFAQEIHQMPVNTFDISKQSQTILDHHNKNTTKSSLERSQEPVLYNPSTFSIGNQQITQQASDVFESEMEHNFGSFQPPPCDSALNTSKYNMSSIQKPSSQPNAPSTIPLLPAASFFDLPQTLILPQFPKEEEAEIKTLTHTFTKDDAQPLESQQEQFDAKNLEINKMLSDTPVPAIPFKSKTDLATDELNKQKDVERAQKLKDGSLIESLSKDDIPILGVSTLPLFGLSALIADKSREKTESEKPSVPFFDVTQQTRNLFEGNSSVSFFENAAPENKFISESQLKEIPLDITALSITDVKNVLVIEPPQENIVALLKRNASSNKLESLQKAEESSEHFKQQNDELPSTVFQEKSKIKFDENASEIFFKHSGTEEKEEILQRDASVDQDNEDHSELNICETCREVNTPDIHGHEHGQTDVEDLTSQLIENITSRMQLSNPLTVPFTESDLSIDERSRFNDQQFAEITQVAEDTIETLQIQSATELLDDQITSSEPRKYGWTCENAAYLATPNVEHDYAAKIDSDPETPKHDYGLRIDAAMSAPIAEQDYKFELDPNAIGLFGDNSLFFDNLPTNASDEIKAEIKHSHDDVVLPRQISVPSAPPQEEDCKSDEPGVLDVNSIEQDAKKDFPLEEEFIIEPSADDVLSTDDNKIEFRERKRSSEDSSSNDTFTNRVERFKKTVDYPNDDPFEQKKSEVFSSPPMSMASYFDTGNYAVESHYRNSLNSPTSIAAFQLSSNVMRIPPGFEEEYARRLSGMSIGSGENKSEPYIPDTSTQTRPIATPTYSTPQEAKENIETFIKAFNEGKTVSPNPVITCENVQTLDRPVESAERVQPVFVDPISVQPDLLPPNVQSLPDPMKFFTANAEEEKQSPEHKPDNTNRLASYFSMPPAQPEHSKSFFELSQSQNHYRHELNTEDAINVPKPLFGSRQNHNHHIDDDAKNNIRDLMRDLTSPQNIKENVIKTVNYFTLEYDNDIKRDTNAAFIEVKSDTLKLDTKIRKEKQADIKLVESYAKDINGLANCRYCRNYIPEVNSKDFKVKSAVNGNSETNKGAAMSEMEKTGTAATPVNLTDYDVEGQAEDGVTVLSENRATSEYTPVKHHWFYRVDVEEKSVWRGFSNTDSQALEDTYHSPDLDQNTLVATDGGRYDVNVMGRLRIAVYWKEKPTNVRRCSWFYKGTTDARYVPYTEAVAEKLEEEYRHGITTNEWHRKLPLPNNEMVIMHGPSVMVHFLHSTTDTFSSPPALLGKHVYRNPPKIRMARDQKPNIDHLLFVVHGAGEYKNRRTIDQTTARPRVVRRSHEESEIEDPEPSKIDHLLLLCHGVGSACDMKFRSVEEVVEDFRTTSLQLLQSHYKNSYENGVVSRVEVLPISWHEQLHAGEAGVDRRLARLTLDSIPRLRAFTNHTVLDVLFYSSPVFHQTIIDTVCSEMNRVYSVFAKRNPLFKGGVSLGGHSLGSVILYDLLCNQMPKSPTFKSSPEKIYVPGAAVTQQPPVKYPQLSFSPEALYALGSPIAIFECIRGVDALGMKFALPTCKNFFNIFHPYDPIAYRIEPLVNPQLQEVKPSQIPHHKGRKRMHLELKDTMARVGADLKQKLIESLRTTWNKWKASPPPDGQLEKVVEEELEKEQLCDDEQAAEAQATPDMLGQLNDGRRIDYVLQEAPLEMINEYLFAMSSHVGYWESEDTMLLILREIYSCLGVQPDSTVPQQNMTVQRTKTFSSNDDIRGETIKEDCPSTSRGGT